ncbi:DUF3467 domain-containing protein [Desulfovibrio sp. ZJ369]|uniref:DUF3467 domain-containing protein n=1 Tax=Desulfovibrio sp. ZJ369 TaxID=2709793 RepID=UPI0013EC551D|nr:DUF3467 domain-containing protein [Desulfovibrio sp. ZJ369]
MSKEKKQTATADAAASQQIRVALNSAQLVTSYANVFQTRCTAEEVILCCGLSLPESLNGPDGNAENGLAVDLDRRIVMSPASAQRLLLALDRTLREHAARFGTDSPQA